MASRRELIQSLGVAGVALFAGCGGEDNHLDDLELRNHTDDEKSVEVHHSIKNSNESYSRTVAGNSSEYISGFFEDPGEHTIQVIVSNSLSNSLELRVRGSSENLHPPGLVVFLEPSKINFAWRG